MFVCGMSQKVMEDPDICLGSKGFYSYLYICRGDCEFANPGSAQILNDLSLSSWDVVRRYTKELETKGYLMTCRDMSVPVGKGNRRVEYRFEEPENGYKLCESLTRTIMDVFCSVEARGLFAYFAVHADSKGRVLLTRDKVLKDLGCSKTTYTKYASELERLGYLIRGRYYDEDGRAAGMLYELTV